MRANRTIAVALAAAGDSHARRLQRQLRHRRRPRPSVLNIGMPDGPQPDNNNPFLGHLLRRSSATAGMICEPLALANEIQPADGKPWLATGLVEGLHARSCSRSGTTSSGRTDGDHRRGRRLHVQSGEGHDGRSTTSAPLKESRQR